MNIDLHMHTEYSDGLETTPKANIKQSAENGINIVSISDHDTYFGYEESLKAGTEYGVTVIPGVEISTWKCHLLALNFDPQNEYFSNFIKQCGKIRNDFYYEGADALGNTGAPIDSSYLEERFPNSSLGIFNFLRALEEKPEGEAYLERIMPKSNTPERIQGLIDLIYNLTNKTLNFVSNKQAIESVHYAGGLIGIAHPPQNFNTQDEILLLMEQGIDFLEVQPNEIDKYARSGISYDLVERIGKHYGLPISFGSDYHGPLRESKKLLKADGRNVLRDDLRDLLNKGYQKIGN
jgi:histidinol phosphatase-like PHP family hydrolase